MPLPPRRRGWPWRGGSPPTSWTPTASGSGSSATVHPSAPPDAVTSSCGATSWPPTAPTRSPPTQVAALIAHGIGRLRHGHTRFDLLWAVWTIPWDFIRGLAHAIGRRLAWIPLVQFAWRTRFVVGTIAVVLEAQAGRWPSPIIIAVFITLSYLMPYCRGAWERRLTEAGDRYVAERAARSRSLLGAQPIVAKLAHYSGDATAS